jgi:hypothetical protein
MKKRLYKQVNIDPGVTLRVYEVKKNSDVFYLVILQYKGWSIPLSKGYTPWGAVALATLSPYVRGSEKLERALTLLSQVII